MKLSIISIYCTLLFALYLTVQYPKVKDAPPSCNPCPFVR